MATNQTAPQTKISWHLLQAWVSEQQAYESRTSQPAPITSTQEKALITILRSIEPTKEAPSADLTKTNWIGDLQEYFQKRGQTLPPQAYIFEEDPNTLPGAPPQFRCFVTIPGHSQAFPPGPPSPEDGTGDEIHSFPRKDLAKKYAAKCAITYLTGRDRESRTEATVRAAEASAPAQAAAGQTIASSSLTSETADVDLRGGDGAQQRPAKLPRTQSPQLRGPSSTTANIPGLSIPQPSAQGKSTVSPGHRSSTKTGSRNSSKKGESFVARLANLCAAKGVESPQYKITPSPMGRTAAGELFNGFPVFKTATLTLPEGTGHVQNVLGQKEAKESIAKAVFEYMDEDHKKFLERVDVFMNNLPE